MEKHMNKQFKVGGGKIQLALAMVIFGTIGLFIRTINLPSSVIAMARGFVGSLFLLGLIVASHGKISWQDISRNKKILIFSGGFLGINWILLFEAFRYTTLASATLVYYLAPVIVIIVSAIFFKESLEPLKVVCVGLALIGMVLVSGLLGSDFSNGPNLTGILFALGAAICYAAVILMSQRLESISAYDGTIIQLATSGLVLLPYVLITEDFKILTVDRSSLYSLVIVAIIHTGVAYALYFSAMRKLKAQTIAIYSYLDPLVAVIASSLILKEKVTVMTAVGGLLILGSTLLSEVLDQRRVME